MSTHGGAAHAHGAEICPDPSAHSKDTKLQDSASKAALYATSSQRSSTNPLGPDGKLSSASAATSLKYAQPHELPSFPSVGIDTENSGNKAATLANANQKPFEHWQPELSSSASKAALLAHKDGVKLNLWQPTASESGMTAAGAAMHIKSSPQLDYGYTEDGRKRALLAATLSVSGRAKEPEQAPAKLYPDQENAASNALNAASVANRPVTRTSTYVPVSETANEAARLSHGTNFNKAMYGEHPPVDIEVQEQKYQAALRASSISIAKQMQEVQARKTEDQYYAGLVAEDKSFAARTGSKNTPDNIRSQALGYLNLQEAAQRLAAERLKKLDPDGVLAYREHWGTGLYADQPKDKEKDKEEKQRSKLSSRAQRFLSRGSQEEDDFSSDSDSDVAEAARIRGQMRGMNTELASIDAKKRDTDRATLLALAEKQVKARLAGMDEKVFRETGKASPQLMAQWEEKARAKAAANNEERMKNYGKVHIGGGQYMEQSELDAIAQRRMQPTLDEITEAAEKQRARDAEITADQKQRRYEAGVQRAQEREEKAEQKRVKDDEKMQATFEKNQRKEEAAELKREQQAREREEKEVILAQKRLEKEQAQQAKDEAKMAKAAEKEQANKAKEEAKQAKLAEKEEANKAKEEAKQAKLADKEEAKRAKEEARRTNEAEHQNRAAEGAVVAGAAGAGAAGGAAAAAPEAAPQLQDSELGETVIHSVGTRTAHDSSAQGVPTAFEQSEIPTSTAVAYEHEPASSQSYTTHEQDSPVWTDNPPAAVHTTNVTAAAPIVASGYTTSTAVGGSQDLAKDTPIESESSSATAPAAVAAAAVPAASATNYSSMTAAGTNHGQTYTIGETSGATQTSSTASPVSAASPKTDRSSKRGSLLSKFRRSHDEPSADYSPEADAREDSSKRGRKSKDREPGTLKKLTRAINDPVEQHTTEGSSATEHQMTFVDKDELNVTGSKNGPHRKTNLFSRIKHAINDPAQDHTREGGAATEHKLQSVNNNEKSSIAAATTGGGRARSPSPDIGPLEEGRVDRKTSVESSDVFQEASDRLDPDAASPVGPKPATTESKFHEEV